MDAEEGKHDSTAIGGPVEYAEKMWIERPALGKSAQRQALSFIRLGNSVICRQADSARPMARASAALAR